MSNQFDWVPFYHDFAKALLPYRNKQSDLLARIKEAFNAISIKLPTLDDTGTIDHMDPFTVLGLFNKSGMKDEKRLCIIDSLAKSLGVDTTLPTRFDGIPVLYPLGATFYPFPEKTNDELFDHLWDLLDTALRYAETQENHLRVRLEELITYAIKIKYNGNSKITMALYWIAPDTFINLDSRNEWYIYASGKIKQDLIKDLPKIHGNLTGKAYFSILEGIREILPEIGFHGFTDLSYEAWRYSEEINVQNKKAKEEALAKEKGDGLADSDVRTVRYWMISPGVGASKWDRFSSENIIGIGWDEMGDLSQYATKEDMRLKMQELYGPNRSYKNDVHATWQFANEMMPGDIVYAKKGRNILLGRGIVLSGYEFDDSMADFKNIHHVEWTHRGEWQHDEQMILKTLTDMTQFTKHVQDLEALFADSETEQPILMETSLQQNYPAYDEEHFLKDVYMDQAAYEILVALIRKKKNVILQGAPGVGKTYAAKRLAYSMMGEKNQERVQMVQFHQSYSYEDFIEGFRPAGSGNGFEIKKGSFYHFCRKAAEDLENEYFFIIDEINRGNLSRIFGELFMLIENDKRGNELQLLYSDEKFSVPGNVYILGMMNTADRSLAMLDYALRRRFAFYDMKPAFESAGFREYRTGLNSDRYNRLIDCVEKLNNAIREDESLGEGFCIGHSYFCNLKEEEVSVPALAGIIEYELCPLLLEYWYDDRTKANDWIARLKDAIK